MARQRNSKIIGFVIFTIIVVALMVLVVIFSEKPIYTSEFELFFEVVSEDKVGIELNATALTFGRTSPGGHGITRFLNVTNEHSHPVRAEVVFSENVAPAFESVEPVAIDVHGFAVVPLHLKVPSHFSEGNYTGTVSLILFRVESYEN